MTPILLLGGGGHCKSIIDTIKSSNLYDIVGIIDLKDSVGKEVNGIKIIDHEENLNLYRNTIDNAFISIGSIGNVSIRKKVFLKLKKLNFNIPSIIDKTSIIGENVTIGNGTFIGKGSIINANVSIGENCIINSGVILEHDCKIDNFVHIAPGSIICGGVSISENSHIGAGTTIIQNKTIGNNTIIGAGSLITKDIGDNIVAYGNPAREVRKNE